VPTVARAQHRRRGTVLDYGCGFRHIGDRCTKARRAPRRRVDIDPGAVATARANARRNDVAGEFLEDCAPLNFTADVVIANIPRQSVEAARSDARIRCRHGGHIALSGILAEQVSDVESFTRPGSRSWPPAEAEGLGMASQGSSCEHDHTLPRLRYRISRDRATNFVRVRVQVRCGALRGSFRCAFCAESGPS